MTTIPDVSDGDLISATWGDDVRLAVEELQAAPPAHGSTHQPGSADAIPTATAGASAVADTAATGTSTSLSRADHRHSREAFAAPAASAPGDAQVTGTATTVPHSDHKHARETREPIRGFYGHATTQSIANNADDPIEWTEDVDTDAFHSGTANAIVIPAGLGGWYAIQASALFGSGSTSRTLRIQKNGADLGYGNDGTTGTKRTVAWIGPLVAGDSITIVALANAAGVTADAQVGLYWLGV